MDNKTFVPKLANFDTDCDIWDREINMYTIKTLDTKLHQISSLGKDDIGHKCFHSVEL